MSRYLTKAQALASFRELWEEACVNNPSLRGDVIAKREEWNNYTDALCKDRQITARQYDTWSNPF